MPRTEWYLDDLLADVNKASLGQIGAGIRIISQVPPCFGGGLEEQTSPFLKCSPLRKCTVVTTGREVNL